MSGLVLNHHAMWRLNSHAAMHAMHGDGARGRTQGSASFPLFVSLSTAATVSATGAPVLTFGLLCVCFQALMALTESQQQDAAGQQGSAEPGSTGADGAQGAGNGSVPENCLWCVLGSLAQPA